MELNSLVQVLVYADGINVLDENINTVTRKKNWHASEDSDSKINVSKWT